MRKPTPPHCIAAHSPYPCRLPGVMDIILISPNKLDFPSAGTAAPSTGIEWWKQPAVVGLVVGTNFSSGSKLFQVKLRAKQWLAIRDQARIVPAGGQRNGAVPVAKPGASVSKTATYRMYYTIVENVRSNWREFQALHELGTNITLVKEVLASNRTMVMEPTPPSSPVVSRSRESPVVIPQTRLVGLSAGFTSYLQNTFNPSQVHAITTAAASKGFTLIQGPPGTGKTSTIIGMLNALHMREYNKYYEDLLKAFLGPAGLACRAKGDDSQWLQLLSKISKAKPRILVVAPSNVAVDNIILRIVTNKFLDGSGARYMPCIVRVGRSKVESVTLEELVDNELMSGTSFEVKKAKLQELHGKVAKAIQEVVGLQSMLINMKTAFDSSNPLPENWELRISGETAQPYWVNHATKTTSSRAPPPPTAGIAVGYRTLHNLPEYRIFSHRLTQILSMLDTLQLKRSRLMAIIDEQNMRNRDTLSAATREMIESSIIDEAQLLFTTLNSCGHQSMESTEFCLTVVDEAAQCVEPSTLIALRRGCKQCVMVGDQKQLPATVFSEAVRRQGYDRSLFERLISCGHPYVLLDTQYRMTPDISLFPNRMFYDGQLNDGMNVQANAYLPSFITACSGLQDYPPTGTLLPLLFFDLRYSREQESTSSLSKINPEEVKYCMKLLAFLLELLAAKGAALSIGVITPYQDQLIELQKAFKKKIPAFKKLAGLSNDSSLGIEFNTVDGFQGKEKDIVLISTVRANETRRIGFLSDVRRMNVAITRARFAMMIIGHASTLSSDSLWGALVDHCQIKRCLFPVHHEHMDIAQVLRRENAKYVHNVSLPSNGSMDSVPNAMNAHSHPRAAGSAGKRKWEQAIDEDGELQES